MFSACNAAWPRRPERRELSVIKIRSSMPPAAYQRLDANPTSHMQMRFLGSTVSGLSQRPPPLDEADAGPPQEGCRLFSKGDRKRSWLCTGLFGVGGLL